MSDYVNNSSLDAIALAIDETSIDEASVDTKINPLVNSQSINPVTPSILSIPKKNNISTETVINENNDSIICARKDDNVTYSNSDFELYVSDLAYFMDSTKDNVINHVSISALDCIHQNNSAISNTNLI